MIDKQASDISFESLPADRNAVVEFSPHTPKIIIPQCSDCGYMHVENGDGTSTTMMRRSVMIFGQDCRTCGVRFGHEASSKE